MADVTTTYTKFRRNLGSQPIFCCTLPVMLDSINPDISEQRKYILRNPVHTASQATLNQSEHFVNTKPVIMVRQNINHVEGGWPKEININDEEATQRYKRRLEKDDEYVDFVQGIYSKAHHKILQNNAIDMYGMYFADMPPVNTIEKPGVRVNNCYRDLYKRPISCICWTKDDDAKLVVSYCNRKFPITVNPPNEKNVCFIWNLENPNTPETEFEPPCACWQVATSPVQPALIMGGLNDGRVCVFDLRAKSVPVNISSPYLSHRDPVSALLFIESRQNTDFFSGSSDGCCMWWDMRDLSKPTETVIMAIKVPPGESMSMAHAEPVSVIQFERAFPTRYLCGTDTGLVINVNRKGKTLTEMMSAVFKAHKGPVKAIHRSPCAPKIFMTCGDWTVNIWSDDIYTSPIITGIPHRYQINDAVWCPQRLSSYMSVSEDGFFRIWDILRKGNEPVLKLKVTKSKLLKIKPHYKGKIVAVGSDKGSLYTLSLSPCLASSGDNDKPLIIKTFEREARREHILEARVKEIRLKLKQEEEAVPEPIEPVENEELAIKTAEENYKKAVMEESRRCKSNISHNQMRKR